MAERLDLRQLQAEVRDWAEYNFPDTPAYRPLLGAVEEVGELAHAHLKREQQIRAMASLLDEKARDAVGDIIIYLVHYCALRGWDLEDIIRTTWVGVKQRDWRKNPKTGVA